MATREEELAQLIAEQEKDIQSGDRVYSSSLDAALTEDGSMTWSDLLVAENVGLPRSEAPERTERRSAVSGPGHGTLRGYQLGCRCDRCAETYKTYFAERRRLGPTKRAKHGTLSMYNLYGCRCEACFAVRSLYNKIAWRRRTRRGTRANLVLLDRLRIAAEDYLAGARIIDVAERIYQDAGYVSPESCYQQLRLLFHEIGVEVRPGRWQHGMRSEKATDEQRRAYRNEKNARLRAKGLTSRGDRMVRCSGRTREGRACKRLAIRGSEFCVVHAMPHPTQKWTVENVTDALRNWTREHGGFPRPHDWNRASESHPNFRTVYSLFGSWPRARDAALTPDEQVQ